ncbi:flagellar protein FlgN [Clostridium grantii]|uniref:FlgN protein n=1 Tax=Clostridium grantii DSM 8605 TaxID=1121316 RepID=A0A1M5W7F0_9CLOT|nr:flagellar protein FlgN [Clostridium grantii]SHH83358.1 FlgN protein [Clostridium grantii DSM 8605]
MDIFHLYEIEENLLKNLKQCLEKEKNILIKSDWVKMNDLIKEKQEILNVITLLEKERMDLGEENIKNMEKANSNKNFHENKINIKKLIIEIQELNETNVLLTKSSLNYTKVMLNSLGVNNKANTYGANGKVGNNSNNMNISINQSV